MRVLISGAGIAGPTLAFWLARLGHHITIIDIRRDFEATGQNIDLCGAAITIVKRMGIEKRIKELNTTEKGMQLVDEHDRVLARFDVKDGGPSPTSPYEILRGDLAMILADATKDHPNVTYKFDAAVERVLSNDEKSVKVKFTNGDVEDFDLAVAADGQWSRLRKMCFDPSDLQVLDKNMYIAYFTVPRIPEDTDYWKVCLALRRRGVWCRPDPHGTLRAAFTIMPTTAEHKDAWESACRGDPQAQISLIKGEFADVGWQAPRFLREVDSSPDFYMHGIKQIRLRKWATGRVVCLGDAAWAPTPLTGMGTPLAIIGAYVLAGEISNLQLGEHPGGAFESFDKGFRPFVEKVQHIPSIAPGLFHPSTSWQRWLLQTAMSTMSKVLSIPAVSNMFGGFNDPEADDHGFPMPKYPLVESVC